VCVVRVHSKTHAERERVVRARVFVCSVAFNKTKIKHVYSLRCYYYYYYYTYARSNVKGMKNDCPPPYTSIVLWWRTGSSSSSSSSSRCRGCLYTSMKRRLPRDERRRVREKSARGICTHNTYVLHSSCCIIYVNYYKHTHTHEYITLIHIVRILGSGEKNR